MFCVLKNTYHIFLFSVLCGVFFSCFFWLVGYKNKLFVMMREERKVDEMKPPVKNIHSFYLFIFIGLFYG